MFIEIAKQLLRLLFVLTQTKNQRMPCGYYRPTMCFTHYSPWTDEHKGAEAKHDDALRNVHNGKRSKMFRQTCGQRLCTPPNSYCIFRVCRFRASLHMMSECERAVIPQNERQGHTNAPFRHKMPATDKRAYSNINTHKHSHTNT